MTKQQHSEAWQKNRAALAEAARSGDEERQKQLSQERQSLKHYRFCVDCGQRLVKGFRCRLHYVAKRYYRNAIAFSTACLVALAVFAAQPSGNVILGWNYPTNSMSPDLVFQVRGNNNLSGSVTNWPIITNVPGPLMTTIVGTNYACQAQVQIQPGQFYFAIVASNWWGQADPSNVASTPPLPRSDEVLTITRGP